MSGPKESLGGFAGTLVSLARDAIVTVDGVGCIRSWNPAAEGMFGYGEAAIVGSPLAVLFRESHWGWLEKVVVERRMAPTGALMEWIARKADGSEFPVEFVVNPVEADGSRFLVAIIRDVSERQRTAARMRLQTVALEAAVNSVVITDTKGNIEWVNPAFCRVSGYSREEAIGQNPRVLKSGVQPAAYYGSLWATISAGRSWQGEFVNRRKDGGLYTEAVTITPVRDEEGQIAHYIAIKQDVSALKQSLAELEVAHLELQRKNQALDAALVEARSAEEAKAAFLGMMSHEIRTPLNGVIGMAGLLRETQPLTAEQKEFTDTVLSSAEILLNMVNALLDFSKLESGRMRLDRAPFGLRGCLECAMKGFEVRARERGLWLELKMDPALPESVVGDQLRLAQLVTNLVGNAVKFTERGGVTVEARKESGGGEGSLLVLVVSDTGIGMPAGQMGRLFQTFGQLDASATRAYGGTGMGLAICKLLVQLMGGRIEVVSEVGRGSVFTLKLPLPEPFGEDGMSLDGGLPNRGGTELNGP